MALRAIDPRGGARGKDLDRLLSGASPQDQRSAFLGSLVQDLQEASAHGAPDVVAAHHLEKMRAVASTSAVTAGPQPILEGSFGEEEYLPAVRRGRARLLGVAAAACVVLIGAMAVVGLPDGRRGGVRSVPAFRDVNSTPLPAGDGTSVSQPLFTGGSTPSPRSSGGPNRSGGPLSGEIPVAVPSPIAVVTASFRAHGSEPRSGASETSSSGGSNDGTGGGGSGGSGGGTSTGQDPTTTGTGGAMDSTKGRGKGHGRGGKAGGGADGQAKSVGRKHGGTH